MTEPRAPSEASWTPSSCTLPTIEQPLRLQQFDELFLDTVTSVDRIDPTTTRFTLQPEPQLAGRAAELSRRESACCSFFTFVLTFTDGAVTLDISVPTAQVHILDALTARARQVGPGGA